MAQPDRIILLYLALADVSGKMLAAARAEHWDSLVMLEVECAAQVAALRSDEALASLSGQQNQTKAALIIRILADDGELRQLLAARMAQLSNRMHSASTERKLLRAYGG